MAISCFLVSYHAFWEVTLALQEKMMVGSWGNWQQLWHSCLLLCLAMLLMTFMLGLPESYASAWIELMHLWKRNMVGSVILIIVHGSHWICSYIQLTIIYSFSCDLSVPSSVWSDFLTLSGYPGAIVGLDELSATSAPSIATALEALSRKLEERIADLDPENKEHQKVAESLAVPLYPWDIWLVAGCNLKNFLSSACTIYSFSPGRWHACIISHRRILCYAILMLLSFFSVVTGCSLSICLAQCCKAEGVIITWFCNWWIRNGEGYSSRYWNGGIRWFEWITRTVERYNCGVLLGEIAASRGAFLYLHGFCIYSKPR